MISSNRFFHFRKTSLFLMSALVLVLLTAACGSSNSGAEAFTISNEKGTRDNTPLCLTPTADGKVLYGNDHVHIDASNTDQGYLIIQYTGSSDKVKLQITGPDTIKYTYALATNGGRKEVFPFSAGSGQYQVSVYENIRLNQYSTAYSTGMDISLEDENLPFLYPNQYVTFDQNTKAIQLGAQLARSADSDLDVVSNVYNYIVSTIDYDEETATAIAEGAYSGSYIPDLDAILEKKKGICLDYASLMTAMLRSQRIPTKMEVGYAGSAYHSWISTYIDDIGWVNGIIEFDGVDWQLMDPTFASNMGEKKLESFIGDASNYTLKYMY